MWPRVRLRRRSIGAITNGGGETTMPKYKPGDSICWPTHPRGWRLILGVTDTNYKVSDFYNEDGSPYTGGDQLTELAIEFVDQHYRAVATSGQENVVADTAEVERLREQLASQHRIADELRNDAEIIGEALLEEAEGRDWCSDYDSWVGDVNRRLRRVELPTRSKDYDVTLNYNVSVTVTVNACDEDSAGNIAYEDFDEPDEVRGHYANWSFVDSDAQESDG